MRNMASIQVIKNIENIENSDTLAVATINGWKVVVKRNEYKINDLVIYCEIDSWIPHELAPFLSKDRKVPREYNGIAGERLKTVKLRGQISQGLILSISILNNINLEVETDVSEILNIQKWEAPVDLKMRGESKGNFPSQIPKTDETRIQNFKDYSKLLNQKYYVHEKLEGSSITIYKIDGEFGVCSRNLNLKKNDENKYWYAVKKLNLIEKLKDYDNIALQGELLGPGIQANIYRLSDYEIYFFNVYNVQTDEYFSELASFEFFNLLNLKKVPLIAEDFELPENIDTLIQLSDGESRLNSKTQREGLIYRNNENERISFKAISNNYLLKQK
jgi:RNA ligase (TIGR02306 family)